MSYPTLKGLLTEADKVWHQQHPTGKRFGPTYIDSSPSAWSQQFLGTPYSWTFSQHLTRCIQHNDQFLIGLTLDDLTPPPVPDSVPV
eukprot:7623742-Ditylum_brightwellii.AAC.1